jgi:hypothetical protein
MEPYLHPIHTLRHDAQNSIGRITTLLSLKYAQINNISECHRSRDSSVGIATRYGLDGPGIESRWGRDFPHLSRPALGSTHPPIQGVSGVKRPGRGVDHPPPSSAEVKEIVELYLHSPSGPSWPDLG